MLTTPCLVCDVLIENTSVSRETAPQFANLALTGRVAAPARTWLRKMRTAQKLGQRWIRQMRLAATAKRCRQFWDENQWSDLDVGNPGIPRPSVYDNIMENFWTACVLSHSEPGILNVSRLLVLRLCQLGLLKHTPGFEPSLFCLPTIEMVMDSYGSDAGVDAWPADDAIIPAIHWPAIVPNAPSEAVELGWALVLQAVDRLPECLASIALMGTENFKPFSFSIDFGVSEEESSTDKDEDRSNSPFSVEDF